MDLHLAGEVDIAGAVRLRLDGVLGTGDGLVRAL
jgi:hypothetical protein